MATAARWIRSDPDSPAALRAAWAAFARAQSARAAPAVFWAGDGEGGFAFALVVPLRLAPGRPWRWRAWGLAPCIATYRLFGERAYLDGGDIWLGGRRIAQGEAPAAGDCALVSAGFLGRLAGGHAGWTGRGLEQAFRGRIEAQHGWEFDTGWPSAAERLAIAGARAGNSVGAA